MTVVCPWCQNEIVESQEPQRCSKCCNTFKAIEWPPEAYSTKGLKPRLTFYVDDKPWIPSSTDFIIGRTPGAFGLELHSPTVSSEHVRIVLENNQWFAKKINKSFYWNDIETEQAILSADGTLTIGMQVVKVDIQYEMEYNLAMAEGLLRTTSSVPLNQDKVLIGSDPAADIVIDCPVPLKALVYQQKKTGDWWIVDCGVTGGLFINGERAHNRRLITGDEISLANVSLYFASNSIEPYKKQTEGFSIRVSNLSARSNKNNTILEDVSFAIRSGEFVGILGPSGSGKSSIIQRLIGLASYSEGKIEINGNDFKDCSKSYLSRCAYLPQQTSLHESLTVNEECSCFADLHAHSASDTKHKITSMLKLVGLENETSKRVGDLSGGQQKRLGIALELLRDPGVLLLDEPTSGLDPASEDNVMQYLRRISRQGKTVICSTHMMDNIKLFDKVLLLSKGRVVFYGAPSNALQYFSVNSINSIFKILSEGTDEEQKERADLLANDFNCSGYGLKQEYQTTQSLNPAPKVPFFQQFRAYLKRYLYLLIDFKNAQKPIRKFFGSPLFLQLILQPILIAFIIKWTCAGKFFFTIDFKDLFFFCLISVFWLGMNNSIRELVSERVPGRCLERLEQVSVWTYLLSKFAWTAILCFEQTLLFSLVIFATYEIPIDSTLNSLQYQLFWSVWIPVVLFFTCLIGAWIALAVSAVLSNESSAVAMLPILLIPILLISTSVIRPDHQKRYNLLAVHCERYLPCYSPRIILEDVAKWNIEFNNVREELPLKEQELSHLEQQLEEINAKIKKRILPQDYPKKSDIEGQITTVKNDCDEIQSSLKKAEDRLWEHLWISPKNTPKDDFSYGCIIPQLIYFVLAFLVIVIAQSYKELKWEGR